MSVQELPPGGIFAAQSSQNHAALATVPLTIRELLRHPSFAYGGSRYGELLQAYLPLALGAASSLLPNLPEVSEEIAGSAFQTFALRWRKLPKRTTLAYWLSRTAFFAACRRSKELSLSNSIAIPSASATARLLLEKIFRLDWKQRDSLLLSAVLGVNTDNAARALKISERSLQKHSEKGFRILARKVRKRIPIAELASNLAALPAAIPSETLIASLRECAMTPAKDGLVSANLRSWRRVALKSFFKRFAKSVATIVGTLLFLGATFVWVAQHGFLDAWFLQLGNKDLLKQFPELAVPARAWSPPGAVPSAPRNTEQLYAIEKIWPVKLTLTPSAWEDMQPSHIPPVQNMVQPDGNLILRNPKASRSGLAGVLGLEFNWTKARLDFADASFETVAMRYRGNGTYFNSLYGPKQSFKLDLNKFQKGQKLAGVDSLNLVNAIPDNSYLHDALAEELFRSLGVPAPRTAYAYVTVDVPGKFPNRALGLYVLIENIDDDFAKEHFGSKKAPIFKPVTPDLFSDLGTNWTSYATTYDLKTKITPAQESRLVEFAQLVSHANDEEFARRLPEYLDLQEFAAFTAGHVLLSSYDGFLANGQNYYLYLDPRSNKFGFISWDQDHSWGEFGYVGTADQREHASIWEPAAYHFRFLERVFKVEEFQRIYRQTLEHALAEEFTVERLFPKIDKLAAAIRPAVAAESDFRLRRFDQAIDDTWLPGPRENGSPEGPKAPVHQIKRFITNRIPAIREQLEGKSKGVRVNRTH